MKNSKVEIIISALLTSLTVKEASQKTGIPQPTIYNYLRNKEFKEKYKKAKDELIRQTTNILQFKTAGIINIIDAIAKDIGINPQTRLTACRTLLEYSLKFTEKSDILERLQELEESINV